MPVIAEDVARRFLARSVLSDAAFQPPKEIVNAVDSGQLPPEALNVWKAVVREKEKGSRPVGYDAFRVYWANKCKANGIALPAEFDYSSSKPVGGGQGASQGSWKIKTGDEIEEWVKQTLKSKGLMVEVGKSCHDWQMEIVHLERMIRETNEKIEGRLRGSGKGARTPLERSQAELADFSKQLTEAKSELERLSKEVARYPQAKNYSIEFEKEFQFMMLVAAKDLDKKDVLASVKKAIERFEQGLAIPDAQSPAHDVDRYKNAGILDAIGGALSKAWNWLTSTFKSLIEWFKDLGQDTNKIQSMLDQAGA